MGYTDVTGDVPDETPRHKGRLCLIGGVQVCRMSVYFSFIKGEQHVK